MIYLASPYTHPNRDVEKARARAVTRAAAVLTALHFHVFSPIAYSEPIRKQANTMGVVLPGDWGYWQHFNRYMIERCSTFAILTLAGWQESVGLDNESRIATSLKREICLVDPHFIEAAVPDLARLEANWR